MTDPTPSTADVPTDHTAFSADIQPGRTDPAAEPLPENILSAPAFYDALAGSYDGMTAYHERVARSMSVLAPFVEAHRIRRAVDMGCGTGLHAHTLARLGVETTGIDVSDGMLAQARAHTADLAARPPHDPAGHEPSGHGPAGHDPSGHDPAGHAEPRFVAGDFLSPEIARLEPLDAVFCLGNTLPHVASEDELACVLAHWRTALRAGGVVVVQMLNYARILARRERIVAARRDAETVIVRFYDFTHPRLTFNILTLAGGQGALTHAMQSVLLLPVTDNMLAAAAQRAGFASVALYGSLARDAYGEDAADLVAVLGGGAE